MVQVVCDKCHKFLYEDNYQYSLLNCYSKDSNNNYYLRKRYIITRMNNLGMTSQDITLCPDCEELLTKWLSNSSEK